MVLRGSLVLSKCVPGRRRVKRLLALAMVVFMAKHVSGTLSETNVKLLSVTVRNSGKKVVPGSIVFMQLSDVRATLLLSMSGGILESALTAVGA